jgi:predicted dehydrogenase
MLTTQDKRDATGNLIGVDDNAICIYQMEDGVIGTMTASWTYYAAEDNSTVIYGTKGELRLYDDPKYSVQQLGADGTRIDYQIDQIQTNDNQTASGVIDLFVECLVENKEPEISGENVLHAMKAVFASIESSAKGCAIEIK